MNTEIDFIETFCFWLSFNFHSRTTSLLGWIYGKNGTIFVYDGTSSALRNTKRCGKATTIVGGDIRINSQSKELWNLFQPNWLAVYLYELLKRVNNVSMHALFYAVVEYTINHIYLTLIVLHIVSIVSFI